jgi:hypothetical protein
MPRIALDRYDHFPVAFVSREDSLETVGKFLKGLQLCNTRLEQARLHMREVEILHRSFEVRVTYLELVFAWSSCLEP